MGLAKYLKKIIGVDGGTDQDQGPRYLPQPMDERLPNGASSIAPPVSRADPRYNPDPVDASGPTYNPAPQQPAVAAVAPQGPAYDPPVPQPTSAQPQTMAAKYMASAVPLEDTMRPRNVAPIAQPAGAQVTYVTKRGQQVPTGATGGTDDENNQAYLAALEKYKPENHNSRVRSGLINFGRAYVRGGGLVAATTGLVEGLADPASDERYANERNIATTGRAVAQAAAERKAASELANEQTKRQQEAADIQLKQHPIYEPKLTQADDGTYANITPGGSVATPIYNPTKPGQAPTLFKGKTPAEKAGKTEIRHNEQTGKAEKWTVSNDPDEPSKKVEGWSDPKQDLVKTKFGWVPPGTALTADAARTNQNYRVSRDAKTDTAKAQEQQEKQTEKAQNRVKEASKLKGSADASEQRWNFANQKMSALDQQIATEADPDKKQRLQIARGNWDLERTRARQDNLKATSELGSSYSDLFEAGPGTDIGYARWQPFSVKKARAAGAKQVDIDKAIETAKSRGQSVID